jgi:hypothetical protein
MESHLAENPDCTWQRPDQAVTGRVRRTWQRSPFRQDTARKGEPAFAVSLTTGLTKYVTR